MRMGIALGLVLCLVVGATGLTEDAAKNTKAADGTWTLSSGEMNGKELTEKQLKGGKLVIKGENYTVTLPEQEPVKGKQKLDPSKDPKTIDIKDSSGPHKDKTCLGIYEIKGDELRVTFAEAGKPRPTKFATTPGSGLWLHVWTRVKE